MVRMKIKMGSRGQLVIPKVVRESLGLQENKYITLEVKDNTLEIRKLDEGVVDRWKKIAETEGFDVSKELVYGDRLYEELF